MKYQFPPSITNYRIHVYECDQCGNATHFFSVNFNQLIGKFNPPVEASIESCQVCRDKAHSVVMNVPEFCLAIWKEKQCVNGEQKNSV